MIEQRLARLQEISGIESAEQDQWLYLEEELEQDQLGQNSRVLSAEDFNALDGESLYSSISNLAPNDIGFSFQWNLLSLGLDAGLMHDGFPGAWAHTTGSHEIKVSRWHAACRELNFSQVAAEMTWLDFRQVCVIDSGVDYTHPDLVANMWTNLGEIPSNGIDDDGNGYIDDVHGYNFADDNGDPMDAYTNGHGTHVAGIIGAVGNNRMGVSGVAQDLSIIACKFLLDSGRGLISDAIRCMDYCEAVGAHIITSSAGDPSRSYTFRAAIEEATTASHPSPFPLSFPQQCRLKDEEELEPARGS